MRISIVLSLNLYKTIATVMLLHAGVLFDRE